MSFKYFDKWQKDDCINTCAPKSIDHYSEALVLEWRAFFDKDVCGAILEKTYKSSFWSGDNKALLLMQMDG